MIIEVELDKLEQIQHRAARFITGDYRSSLDTQDLSQPCSPTLTVTH